jgi:hypothetical protein
VLEIRNKKEHRLALSLIVVSHNSQHDNDQEKKLGIELRSVDQRLGN